LELLAAPPLDERAADEVVNHLEPDAFAHRVHEAGNPRAGMRLRERDAAPFEQREHELEVLQLLDGDGVQFLDAPEEVAVTLQRDGGGGGRNGRGACPVPD